MKGSSPTQTPDEKTLCSLGSFDSLTFDPDMGPLIFRVSDSHSKLMLKKVSALTLILTFPKMSDSKLALI